MKKIIKSIWNAAEDQRIQALEIGESILKSLSENDLAGVPVVGIAGGILNVRKKFLEDRFKKNVASYFDAIKNAKEHELNDCLPNDKKDEFYEIGLSILIESEQPLKSHLFGNLHFALSRGMINYGEFHNLILIIYHNSIPVLESVTLFEIDRWLETDAENSIATLATEDLETSMLAISSGLATKEDRQTILSLNGILLYYFGFKKDNQWLNWLGFSPRNLSYVEYDDYKVKPKPIW